VLQYPIRRRRVVQRGIRTGHFESRRCPNSGRRTQPSRPDDGCRAERFRYATATRRGGRRFIRFMIAKTCGSTSKCQNSRIMMDRQRDVNEAVVRRSNDSRVAVGGLFHCRSWGRFCNFTGKNFPVMQRHFNPAVELASSIREANAPMDNEHNDYSSRSRPHRSTTHGQRRTASAASDRKRQHRRVDHE